MSDESEHVRELYRRIYTVVRKIPRGSVATYGQVAELAGIPGGARVAGAAMKTSKPADQLPWQRVIGKAGKLRGRIAIHDPIGAAVQRKLLEDEGVSVGDSGLVALDLYGWLADGARKAKRRDTARREAFGSKQRDTARREASLSKRSRRTVGRTPKRKRGAN